MRWRAASALLLLLARSCGASGPTCQWCTGGTCDSTCDAALRRLDVPWLKAGSGLSVPYWGSPHQSALGAGNRLYEYGYIIHHGDGRNGADYMCSGYNAAVARFGEKEGPTKVLVIAPQVYEIIDKRPSDVIYWDEQDDKNPARKWNWGGNSTSKLNVSISSFDTLDIMVRLMANKNLYPNLRAVYVVGHSSGGQIVQRYALANTVDRSLQLPVKYVVANPSSYTYLDDKRPVLQSMTKLGCNFCVNSTLSRTSYTFRTPSSVERTCPGYNDYGFGLDGKLVPYYETSSSAPVKRLKKLYGQKQVWYASGESDVCDKKWMEEHTCTKCTPDDGGLETTCGDRLQGSCRMERARAFVQAVQHFYAGEAKGHQLVSVPGVGHNGCAMFQSPEVLRAMFPKAREHEVHEESSVATDIITA